VVDIGSHPSPYIDEGTEAIFQRNSKAREGAMIRALERAGDMITKVAA
jgi:hypothetical protein